VTEARTLWQISAGPTSRTYAEVFLRHGVGLIGPAGPGAWTTARSDEDYEGGFVRQIANEVQSGDVFLLRNGLATICAVGLVSGDYQFLPQFDDVNGWDLNHGRRVRWCRLPEDHNFGGSIFGANPPRISHVWNEPVTDYAQRFLNSPPTNWQTAPLPPLPPEEPPLQDNEIPDSLRDLVAQVRDLYPVMWDRRQFPEHPAEDEVIANFTVLLLRALGWHPEHIAIKMRYRDVTLFRALPRIPENCHLVIEAKRLGAGVEGALPQGMGYVQALGVPRDVVVTDGIRYRLYDCQKDFAPVAYANLANLKASALSLFARLKRPS
jgi:hypothetical protein